MNQTVLARSTAAVMALGAVAANVAFFGLGSTFDYPDVLHHPSTEVLASFRDTYDLNFDGVFEAASNSSAGTRH